MTRYQWTVFLAAWLGWGFDVFDGLLFNFVAPVCVPRLLGVTASDPGGTARVTTVTGIVTSVLLIGWGTARHHSARPSRPAPAVRDLPGGRGGLHLGHVRPGLGPLDAHAPALPGRAHRLRRGGGVRLLPAGALPHTAARDGQRVLLQHGPISRGRRTVRRRLG